MVFVLRCRHRVIINRNMVKLFQGGGFKRTIVSGDVSPQTINKVITLETARGLGGDAPTQIVVGNTIALRFGNNDEAFFSFRIPTDYASGDLSIFISPFPTGSETGKSARFQLAYQTRSPGDLISGTTDTLDSGDVALPSTQYQVSLVTFAIPEADVVGKIFVSAKVKRIATIGGNDPISNPAITANTLHYTAYQ